MHRRQCSLLAVIAFVAICIYSTSRMTQFERNIVFEKPEQAQPTTTNTASKVVWVDPPVVKGGPQPKAVPSSDQHPIKHLLNKSRQEFSDIQKRQSQNLGDAVKEYRRRYGMPPPPHFDKWFDFAKANNIQLIDEFDTIYDLITPFWGLKPKTIRARAQEALGREANMLMGVAIRNHKVTHVDGGQEWQQDATKGMMAKFIQHLPDMDLAFNIHDEPRVIVPHDDLSRLVKKARTETMPAANANKKLTNEFSKTAPELSDKMLFEQTKRTRFNDFGHQPTWTHARMSCPPDSPARILEEDERWDDLSQYGVSELGFVYNSTAMSDLCYSPSLSETYGFFAAPNVFRIVHDLFPIFSQSKLSTFNDIIYPSPWYWYGKVQYTPDEDTAWEMKKDQLYWRGSTTGGFSRDGGWRRQHRQQFVRKINSGGQTKIFTNKGTPSQPSWSTTDVPRAEFANLTNVAFSHVGQCDDSDCKDQQDFFSIAEHADQNSAWGYKYLLDIDGNAFSGRFLAFLQSLSLTFKFAIFKEWHNEWLAPWVHYVPLSLRGDDWLETVRFFHDRGLGAADAKTMADESRDWSGKMYRKEDMEAWFFRLLLEYGRVIDDQRAVIGFDLSGSTAKFTHNDDQVGDSVL